MAKPIRNTPILYGKDASAFIENSQKCKDLNARIAERSRIEKSILKLGLMDILQDENRVKH